MNKDGRLETAISGSFKFKPEIDSMREAFADNNITVIAPDEGWLYIPKLVVSGSKNQFRPLPTEQGMTVREIEDRFIVGYGLDYAGSYRNLPYIGELIWD